jgi:hypothetical protein
VLVRTRQEYACTTNWFNQLRRAIWDGDQLLSKIAAEAAPRPRGTSNLIR